jgi:uncharacterized integral membrane protein
MVMRWLIGIPLLFLMILFALSNTDPVRIGLFPTDLSIEIPLSVAILGAMGIGFFFGGLRVWIEALRHRRVARRAQATVKLLEAKQREQAARSPGALVAPRA